MRIERNDFIALDSSKLLSTALKQLRDQQGFRKQLENIFNISIPDTIVFHGSSKKIERFQKNISLGGSNENKEEALIYASSEPDYAIFLALLDIQEGGSASVICEGGQVNKSITVGFVNGESCIGAGYVYVFDGANFLSQENSELTSSRSDLKPIFHIKVEATDLETSVTVE